MTRYVALCLAALAAAGCAGGSPPRVDDLLRGGGLSSGAPLTEARIVQGLKEALRVGTERAVGVTGRRDGYFGNARIRIPMPDDLEALDR
ncbi:MAG TPA: DUF4197 family protein, partial [Thermodesulfobacteriota bacterium]